MASTTILGFEELTSALADKFLTYNQNLGRSEATQVRVLSRTNGGPPVSPSDGDSYIIDTNSGAWSSFAVGDLTWYLSGVWYRLTPTTAREGVRVWINDEDILVVWSGSTWDNLVTTSIGLSGMTDNSVPFVSSGSLIEDTSFNYDPGTDTLSVSNLTVTGTAATLETTNLIVDDPLTKLGDGNASDTLDLGWIAQRASTNVGCIWDESGDEFAFIFTTEEGATAGDVNISSYAGLRVNTLSLDDGDAISPSLLWDDIGFYKAATGQVGLASGGTSFLTLDDEFIRGASGTTSIPGYSFLTSTGTGISNPAAQTLALSANGIQILRGNTAGNVLIGTGSAGADSLLHVWKATAGTVAAPTNTVVTVENSGDAYLSFLTPNANSSGVIFGDVANNDIASMIYDHGDDTLTFTAGAGGFDFLGTGNIGIGGGADGSIKLKVHGDASVADSDPRIIFQDTDSTGAAQKGRLIFRNGSGSDTGLIGFTSASDTDFEFQSTIGDVVLNSGTASGQVILQVNGSEVIKADSNENVVLNNNSLSTTATNGFLYIPTCPGTPTGTPTSFSGRAPIVIDSTNNKLYFYSGSAWRDAGP